MFLKSLSLESRMSSESSTEWPVLKRYGPDALRRIAMPLGGIGTGTVSLGGRGDLRDWELMSRPAKGFVPRLRRSPGSIGPFVALRLAGPAREPTVRVLEGPIEDADYEGARGCSVINAGLPRFTEASFAAAYPLGQVALSEPALPVHVRLEAFNPLIPGDTLRSAIPVAILRYRIFNESSEELDATVCASLPNCVGLDGWTVKRDGPGDLVPTTGAKPKNEYRDGSRVRGLAMSAEGLNPRDTTAGTLALTTLESENVTCRTRWITGSWGDNILDFWDDICADGELSDCNTGDESMASLAVRRTLPARGQCVVTFLLTWRFPNRMPWYPNDDPEGNLRNHYATCYADAWDVAERVADQLPSLEHETVRFVRCFCESDVPEPIKEAALFNLSTLRTQTCFRTKDGHFFGWEGCHDHAGSCYGSCTHVWNYEQATAFMFPELARSMRQVEFQYATREDGHMSFRAKLPLEYATEHGLAAADGQMGCVMKLYRDWQLSGDEALLTELWPKAKKTIQFAWIEGGWDADGDGVMEGCQHNTMDVEYFGPNPQMQSWYLGALRAAEAMARYLNDDDFAEQCHALYARGRRWMSEHLFNGEYFEQIVQSTRPGETVASGLRQHDEVLPGDESPYQLGAGCLIDQLVGQYMAHVCGLGDVVDSEQARTTLRHIVRYNFRNGFHDHFNPMRSFVLNDEAGTLMASYPHGNRPTQPFPYFGEVMTGFEHTLVAHLLYEQQIDEALMVLRAVRDRYDGLRHNPFDEAECGHHYARAMASWASLLAWTGFRWSGVNRTLCFGRTNKKASWFWAAGGAWGTFAQEPNDTGTTFTLSVEHGILPVKRLRLVDGDGHALGEATHNDDKVDPTEPWHGSVSVSVPSDRTS